MTVSAQVLDWEFDYGFEYQGSCRRYVLCCFMFKLLNTYCYVLSGFQIECFVPIECV